MMDRSEVLLGIAMAAWPSSAEELGTCRRCQAKQWGIGQWAMRSGAIVYPMFCKTCGWRTTRYLSKKLVNKLGVDVVFDNTEDWETCVVCGAMGTEEHHFAPTHLFGIESNDWPVMPLCRPCHKRWHELVTPNMSSRRNP